MDPDWWPRREAREARGADFDEEARCAEPPATSQRSEAEAQGAEPPRSGTPVNMGKLDWELFGLPPPLLLLFCGGGGQRFHVAKTAWSIVVGLAG